MAFTTKYLERLNVDELDELLADDEAELSDAEKERIAKVKAEKATPEPKPEPEPEPDKPKPTPKDEPADDDPPWLSKVIDGVSEKVIGSLTSAEEIVDKVTEPEPEPDKPEPKPEPDKPEPEPEPEPEPDKPPNQRKSLAGRFYRE